jgi:hypothetical protein
LGFQVIDARVLAVATASKKRTKDKHDEAGKVIELTVRPEDLALKLPAGGALPPRPSLDTLSQGDLVPGIVEEVRRDCMWVHVSGAAKGRVYMLDASRELEVVKNLPGHFKVGQGVLARVLKTDKETGRLDLRSTSTGSSRARPHRSLNSPSSLNRH